MNALHSALRTLARSPGFTLTAVATLAAGNYTALVRGNNNTTGVGLVEAYNLQ